MRNLILAASLLASPTFSNASDCLVVLSGKITGIYAGNAEDPVQGLFTDGGRITLEVEGHSKSLAIESALKGTSVIIPFNTANGIYKNMFETARTAYLKNARVVIEMNGEAGICTGAIRSFDKVAYSSIVRLQTN